MSKTDFKTNFYNPKASDSVVEIGLVVILW